MSKDTELLAKINAAVAAANDAEQNVTTAQAELVSRSKQVGVLLLEAKKLHPVVKDFEAFLKKVHGLKLSRAYDLLRLAGGRTTDEELRKETRDRVEKHRTKKRLTQPEPTPKKAGVTEPSVTSPLVTEFAEPAAHIDPLEHFKRQIERLPYALAYDLSLWLTDHLITILPEHSAGAKKKVV